MIGIIDYKEDDVDAMTMISNVTMKYETITRGKMEGDNSYTLIEI